MKVGDYVRTKYGISKIISNPNENTFNIDIYKKDRITLRCIKQKDVIKSSPNIIDLIEVGDYVNGVRVEKNKYGELYTSYVYYGGDIGKQCEVYTTWLKEYNENENYIYSILTKEQFEEMEYKL